MGTEKKTISAQVYSDLVGTVRLDKEIKRKLKIHAARQKTTIRSLVEQSVLEALGGELFVIKSTNSKKS